MIDKNNDQISLRKQVALLGITRSSVYYAPKEKADDAVIANEIHDIWHKAPSYGYRKITKHLQRNGYGVNHKRVLRVMRKMGLQAIYQKPKTSVANAEHIKYPYLLNGLTITAPNQVWVTDITYIKLPGGFVYLIAIIDVASRFCVGWTLVNTMDSVNCQVMLADALKRGKTPIILNTDQGSQFTAPGWVDLVEGYGIKVSMDGKGRWADNIYIERFWRTVKYEHVFLYSFDTVTQARASIGTFIHWYNYERLHQSLGYVTPAEIYGETAIGKPLTITHKKITDRLEVSPSVHLELQATLLTSATLSTVERSV